MTASSPFFIFPAVFSCSCYFSCAITNPERAHVESDPEMPGEGCCLLREPRGAHGWGERDSICQERRGVQRLRVGDAEPDAGPPPRWGCHLQASSGAGGDTSFASPHTPSPAAEMVWTQPRNSWATDRSPTYPFYPNTTLSIFKNTKRQIVLFFPQQPIKSQWTTTTKKSIRQ